MGPAFDAALFHLCRGERANTPPQKTGYLDAEAPLADEQEAGEMCAELMEIFSTGSPRCAPPGPGGSGGHACLDSLKPPSRNQNPLPKDQVCDEFDSICGTRSCFPGKCLSEAGVNSTTCLCLCLCLCL